jgi:hypothetical protein
VSEWPILIVYSALPLPVSAAAVSAPASPPAALELLLALLPPPHAIREIAMTAVNKVAIILFFIN